MSTSAMSIPAFAAGDNGRPDNATQVRVLLVTGISGAGKSSALKALEDLGWEAIDNVPLSLLSSLVLPRQRDFQGGGLERPVAIGVDIRSRDFAAQPLLVELDDLRDHDDIDLKLLFIDCDDEELGRRFAETRRRHPLAVDRPLSDGIAHERRLLARLREGADEVVDTTGLGPGELKRILKGRFAVGAEPGLTLFVTSFAFRHGLPREADLVFDVRFLANPHYDAGLRSQTGRDPAVADFITGDGGFAAFFDSLTRMLEPLLPRFAAEGKSYLTIAIGCTGGRHRSVFVAERLAAWLETLGFSASLHHRDLAPTTERSTP